MSRTIDVHVFCHQLAIVLIGREHIGVNTQLACLCGQSTYHIISFIAINFKDGYVPCAQEVFDDGNRLADVFWSCLTLCFVFWECFAAKCGSMRVKCHANVCGLLFRKYFLEGVYKPYDC